MNKNLIKSYAPQARKDFIQAVTDRASKLGLSEDSIEPVEFEGDIAKIGGQAFSKKVGELRQELERRIKRKGFDQFIEAMAYTWFNRFVALRYMEIHDYLNHGYRVLSNRSGSDVPEILEYAAEIHFPGLNQEEVIQLKLAGDQDNLLFKKLILAQCNALNEAMPFLFEHIDDATELLLPDNLLHSDSPVQELVQALPEEEWQDVEVIGWIYQFYMSEKKS
ncbi:MAG TPA: SAM-dependent methyltransferase, partial [Desulfohalobiaceae bacterium]|nr:SAM-dependent methyltransferase [Desulfohalobiaceae bacterium]